MFSEPLNCRQCGYLVSHHEHFCARCGFTLPAGAALGLQVKSLVARELPAAAKDLFKDSNYVEATLAERVAERVLKWAKYAGAIISIPVAALAALGAKAYIDLSDVSKELDKFEKRAQVLASQVDKGEEQARVLEVKIAAQMRQLDQAASAVQTATSKAGALDEQGVKLTVSLTKLGERIAKNEELAAQQFAALKQRLTTVEKRIAIPKYENYTKALDILARTIWGEARGGNKELREAIAAVVANRANLASTAGRSVLGETVEEVCLKAWQFPAWTPGNPNRGPMIAVDERDPIFIESRDIARRLLAGELVDRVSGATHFHFEGIQPAWARGHQPVARIDKLLFYARLELG
ncbi:cell wall hydrolase [Ideonella sp. 4Y16]|uniref:cell wall hydrolase n=1 Tax=Ideonella alba TaxID=2824118 RepID=UPI001B396948|nr:cell wall hydrolase [Ideonella alba]MBQ0946388.1 cell wall hydrolase [Ideonella alba]